MNQGDNSTSVIKVPLVVGGGGVLWSINEWNILFHRFTNQLRYRM